MTLLKDLVKLNENVDTAPHKLAVPENIKGIEIKVLRDYDYANSVMYKYFIYNKTNLVAVIDKHSGSTDVYFDFEPDNIKQFSKFPAALKAVINDWDSLTKDMGKPTKEQESQHMDLVRYKENRAKSVFKQS